ncbi:MAG: cell division protein FtsL [Pseudomonadota bacterium]|jgi:cell division protein FtsL
MTARQSRIAVAGLWLAVLASALAAVWVSHHCRRLYAQLAELERTEHHLQVEWGRYLLERSTLASPGRIENQAREQYGLRAPALDEIVRMRP